MRSLQGAGDEHDHRNNPKSMQQILQELNRYLRGWGNYFKVQENRSAFDSLDHWVRQRLRSMQLAKWKKPKRFQKAMINAGIPQSHAERIWVATTAWHSVHRVRGSTGAEHRMVPQHGVNIPVRLFIETHQLTRRSPWSSIEEPLTWSVRAVLLGGGAREGASYQIQSRLCLTQTSPVSLTDGF